MAVQIQFRRDTNANWTSANSILAAGEMGINTTTTQFKIGDGTTPWNSLSYASLSGTVADLNDVTNVTIVDAVNGDLLKWNGTAWVNASGYALLASPTLTGTPAAPTAAANTNTTQIATTAFVTGAVTDLIGGAPGALNTLNELADAIGDDASYAAGITTALGLKAPLASPTFTGTVTVPTPVNNTDAVTKAYVDSGVSTAGDGEFALLTGATFTGAINTPNSTGSMIPFYYASAASFPAANNSHGALAHSHATGLMYYAHGGAWIEMANLASPIFTGTPTLPTGTIATTQTAANNTTAIATTAYVDTADALKANLASPTFTGTVISDGLTVDGLFTLSELTETTADVSITSSVLTVNYTQTNTVYSSAPSANFTVNLTNVPTTDNRTITISIMVPQGATGYIPSAFQIEGAAQTIKWSGGSAPSGTSSKIDIFSFTLLRRASTWLVLAAVSANY